MRKSALLPVLCLVLAVSAARADYFAGGYYTPNRGKVGQPLLSDAAFAVADMPPGCGAIQWQTISVDGTLPPGLAPPGANATLVAPLADANGIPINQAEVPDIAASAVSGTPSRSGDWPVIITFHGLFCSSGKSYGDRAIKVNFHIEP